MFNKISPDFFKRTPFERCPFELWVSDHIIKEYYQPGKIRVHYSSLDYLNGRDDYKLILFTHDMCHALLYFINGDYYKLKLINFGLNAYEPDLKIMQSNILDEAKILAFQEVLFPYNDSLFERYSALRNVAERDLKDRITKDFLAKAEKLFYSTVDTCNLRKKYLINKYNEMADYIESSKNV